MALRQADVFRKAGSYDSRPPSPSAALICARSVARIAPSTIGSEYSRPVRLSTIVRVSDGNAASLVERHSDWTLPGSLPREPHHALRGGAAREQVGDARLAFVLARDPHRLATPNGVGRVDRGARGEQLVDHAEALVVGGHDERADARLGGHDERADARLERRLGRQPVAQIA